MRSPVPSWRSAPLIRSGSGDASNASFDVSQIGAQYQGFGQFAKVGTSNWTLTGTNVAALPLTVQQGILSVNGSLANSTFTVNSGGTLGGTGTVGTTMVNGGTLAPGPFGTLTVNGNLSLSAGATYLVDVSPNAAYHSNTNVSGTANLARRGAVAGVEPDICTVAADRAVGGGRHHQ